MFIATSDNIREIDEYAEHKLGISTCTLMGRAGEAIAEAVRELAPSGRVLILAGKGNNGGDGYAAALLLHTTHSVIIYDVLDGGQRSEAGKYYLNLCEREGIAIHRGECPASAFENVDVIVDAIFGTGFSGELSDNLRTLAHTINSSGAKVVAADIPLGVNGDSGECDKDTVSTDITVALCLPKPAHLSYPSREYMGRVVTASLGLDDILASGLFDFTYLATDAELARRLLPQRNITANKGSFGKTLHITGSEKYRGAAHLALEASLRSGVGITAYCGEVAEELRMKYPEAIYESASATDKAAHLCRLCSTYTSTLVGSGSGVSEELCAVVSALLTIEAGPLVLDADAINSIAQYNSAEELKHSSRKVVLTPHPKEFSRLCGLSVEYINTHRLPVAEAFAREHGVILLLKGAGTIVTDGRLTYINTTGSTALAKGGSGDTLAGLVASLVAQVDDTLSAVALAAYLHGKAGDVLSESLSDFGVTPSDLPGEIARQIKYLTTLK